MDTYTQLLAPANLEHNAVLVNRIVDPSKPSANPTSPFIGCVMASGESSNFPVGQLVYVDDGRYYTNCDQVFYQEIEGISCQQVWVGNVHTLDEERLLKPFLPDGSQLGYTFQDLHKLSNLVLASYATYGGDIGVVGPDGEWRCRQRTVLISPVNELSFAMAHSAMTFGADVVALGGDTQLLAALEQQSKVWNICSGKMIVSFQVQVHPEETQRFLIQSLLRQLHPESTDTTIDAYFEMSSSIPPTIETIRAGMSLLKKDGRMIMMGGCSADMALPYDLITSKGLIVLGASPGAGPRSALGGLIHLVHSGVCRIVGPDIEPHECMIAVDDFGQDSDAETDTQVQTPNPGSGFPYGFGNDNADPSAFTFNSNTETAPAFDFGGSRAISPAWSRPPANIRRAATVRSLGLRFARMSVQENIAEE